MSKKSFDEFRNDIIKYNLSMIDRIDDQSLKVDYQFANGCGSSAAWFDFVPDTNWGLDISSACHIHDIAWSRSNSISDLMKANINFKHDLDKIVRAESVWFLLSLRLLRNRTYFTAVKRVGTIDYAIKRGFISDD